MPEAPRLAVAVLAAGQSRRFGSADKLAALLGDSLLGEHACRTLAGLASAQRWVIAARPDHPCAPGWRVAGFEIAVNPAAESGMGSSVALAARLAQEAGAAALLIALADMPLVSLRHFQALVTRAAGLGPDAMIASAAGDVAMPPALFGSAHFAELARASGDVGARHLLAGAERLAGDPTWLIDVDDAEALAIARARLT
jgi:CTP:molybdopterin cytidylyltransferase MocA